MGKKFHDGIYLKEIIDESVKEYDMNPKVFRRAQRVIFNNTDLNTNRKNRRHNVGNLISSFKKDAVSWKRLLDYFVTIGGSELDVKFIINRSTANPIEVELNQCLILREYYMDGIKLKCIVDTINKRLNIPPKLLVSRLRSIAIKRNRQAKTEEITHFVGNVTSSLSKKSISWKRLLDYFSALGGISVTLVIHVHTAVKENDFHIEKTINLEERE